MRNYNYFAPTRVLFGSGELNNLHKQSMPGMKALIAISNGSSTKVNGYLDRTIAELTKAGVQYSVFDKIEPNPFRQTAMDGAKFARANGCDFIVALGGGSVMDCTKAIAAMATNDGDLWDYIHGGTGKGMTIKNAPLKIIAITTTAGTGSEVDEWGVITHEDRNEKIGFGGYESLFPVIAIVDPELMLTVPPKYTAYQGFDALFHSTEVAISKCANSMSDMVAYTAIENIARYLAIAVNDGANIEAREHVAFANTLSGYAMVASSTTSEHSLEHAMSAYHQDLPHGAGLIMISIAYYTQMIERGACPDIFIRMAKVMGVKNAQYPMDFVKALKELQRDCGVDELRMSDYGIKEYEFETLAINAKETMGGLFTADPIDLSVADCVNIYAKSYK